MSSLPVKICSVCKKEKTFDLFNKDKSRKCGLSPRCKDCHYIYNSNWRNKNPEYFVEWRNDNIEKKKENDAKWQKNNKEKVRKRNAKWAEKNPGKVNAKNAKRRALKLQATPPWAELDLIEIVYQKAKEWGAQVDHIVPLNSDIVCGLHCWHNLQLLPPDINITKANKFWPDMP
jgi:hypothetical protein